MVSMVIFTIDEPSDGDDVRLKVSSNSSVHKVSKVPRGTTNLAAAIQCEAPGHDSVQLVQITPMSLWFMVLTTRVTGANLNQQTSLGGLTL